MKFHLTIYGYMLSLIKSYATVIYVHIYSIKKQIKFTELLYHVVYAKRISISEYARVICADVLDFANPIILMYHFNVNNQYTVMIMIMIMIMIEIQGKGTACKPDRYIIRSNKIN